MNASVRFPCTPRGVLWISLCFIIVLALGIPPVVQAEPPPWAPAHGWRKKHDPDYRGYTGHKWAEDYGVLAGHCNTDAVGAVLGGVVGGAIGAQVGKGDGRVVAIILGTVLGAVIGDKLARNMDDTDRACIGHTLELAADGAEVTWVNPATQLSYAVTPVSGFSENGRQCREFATRIAGNGRSEATRSKACRADDGSWDYLTP